MNGGPLHGYGELEMGSLANPFVIFLILCILVGFIAIWLFSRLVGNAIDKGVDYVLREENGESWSLFRPNSSEGQTGCEKSSREGRKEVNRYLEIDLNTQRP